MLTAMLTKEAAERAWAVARYVLPVLAVLVCVWGAWQWDQSRLGKAFAAGSTQAETRCKNEREAAEREAFRLAGLAEAKALAEQAKANEAFETKLDHLLNSYESLKERHERERRKNPSPAVCAVPAVRVRIIREAIDGGSG